MINIVLEVHWSNNPMPVIDLINRPDIAFDVPLGLFTGLDAQVTSVQGKTGAVFLTAQDVGAEQLGAVEILKIYVDEQGILKADINYVDSEVNSLKSSIFVKANKVYVDQQDQLLLDQIDLKADGQAVNQVLSTKADLDESGRVPASQLPSYVDDVLDGRYINPSQFNDLNGNAYIPESGKVYVDVDTNKTYRWSGMLYVVIGGGGVALGETSETAYRGDRGKFAYDHSQSQGNPHNSTTSDITEGNREYFTQPRVRLTPMTGMSTADSSPVVATDTLLQTVGKFQAFNNNLAANVRSTALTGLNIVNATISAADNHLSAFGKLQGQISASSANPIVWVNATALTGISWSTIVDQAKTRLEYAAYQGSIYFRGYITTTSQIGSAGGSPLFTHKDPKYMCDVSFNPSQFVSFVLAKIFATAQFGQTDGQMLVCQNALNGDNQYIQSNGALAAGVYHFAPAMIGKAKS
ncbi:hypothetical protein F889_02615 [Acinetobacter colistiniresistens]|uniref:Uncharacterized protein n=1 Tax=Acinetobacter colistiniresistens TaxID=280145 RepID=N9QV85_9GAMM|nr:hypothetical protein [Acinetobacter colistiniresistens]ENX33951.1 hypothetical protein F889_02615 [Acinetobacter colistiniresistens]